MEFKSFPSIAPRHAGSSGGLPDFLGRRDTVVVAVEGTEYEVGPDSPDIGTNDFSRNLNDQYIHTDQYRALFLGALSYMGESTIDLLVVGLPMNGMANAAKLKELVVGEHAVAGGKRVTVKDALVVPQPVGGLYYCLSLGDFDENLADMADETNLIIDPGYLTFDFVVSHGKKVIENRSNAHPGGVAKVLRLIAESVSAKFNINYDNLGAIESGLAKRKIKINGKAEDLLEHIRSTKPVLEGSVNYMKNIVGDGSDIDNILLIGGGAAIYRKTIEEYYPNHAVTVVDNSPLANVIGFQRIGDSYIKTAS